MVADKVQENLSSLLKNVRDLCKSLSIAYDRRVHWTRSMTSNPSQLDLNANRVVIYFQKL